MPPAWLARPNFRRTATSAPERPRTCRLPRQAERAKQPRNTPATPRGETNAVRPKRSSPGPTRVGPDPPEPSPPEPPPPPDPPEPLDPGSPVFLPPPVVVLPGLCATGTLARAPTLP